MNISIEETKIILTQLALGIFQQQSGQHQTPVSVLNPHIRQAWEYLCAVAYHNHTEILDNFIDFVALLHTPVKEWSIIGEHCQSLNLSSSVLIEIHCRFQKHFRQMADEILKQLHLPSITIDQDPICITDESGNSRLDIVRVQDKHLTDTLSKQENEEDRIAYITQYYKQEPYATGIIIELPDYRKTKQKKFDPKQAIRAGLTRTGRISQFIVPEVDSAKDYDHRYTNRIASLLRMLGYRHQPFYRPHHKRYVPENLDLLAFWIFQLNRGKKRKKTVYLPMVADVPAGHRHMHLIIPTYNPSTMLIHLCNLQHDDDPHEWAGLVINYA